MNEPPTHIDLCSGVGMFSLGLERAGFKTTAFSEIDSFCSNILAKHWPRIVNYGDIRNIIAKFDGPKPAVITAGFPCQPVSLMGKRGGAQDERWLWPQVKDVCSFFKPQFIIIENVANLVRLGLSTVLSGLAEIGYSAEWACVWSSDFGIRQDRQRLYLLAYPNSWIQEKPHEWTVLPRQIAPTPFIEGQPIPNRVRIDYGPTDRVDISRRIGACSNSISPQIAEFIGRCIMKEINLNHNEEGK